MVKAINKDLIYNDEIKIGVSMRLRLFFLGGPEKRFHGAAVFGVRQRRKHRLCGVHRVT